MVQLVERKPFSKSALYVAAALVGLALATSVVFWVKLGTAVFFESIRTGLAYCFG
ncbi:MAG TPA: hypothetical protein VKT73_00305 [Xanthobacteraceae bacterium]|nr:hypothetical protein [Xanthobacteraceae bacterium]